MSAYEDAQASLAEYGIELPNIKTPPLEFLCITNKDGEEKVIPCAENVYRAIRSFNVIRYDSFKAQFEIRISDTWHKREDHHDIQIHSRLAQRFPFLCKQGTGVVRDAISLVGAENTYDSAQDYIQSLVWDETPRIDTWLHKTYKVADTPYHRAVGSNWIKGLIKRIMHPGCKFDYALLLQGAQGVKKSTSLLTLAGEKNHCEFTELKGKEFEQNIQGKLIVEFSEGAVFTKSDQESLKSIITRQQDTYRPPYARASKDFPRRCVFAVTANNDEILKDETGNRRWWVVFVPNEEADIEWLEANREQMFAEARHRVIDLKETTWEVPKDELARMQEQVRMHEQDEDIFNKWYRGLSDAVRANGVTVRQAYCDVFKPCDKNGDRLNEDSVSIHKKVEMSIARTFRHLKLEKQRAQQGGDRSIRWFPCDPLKGYTINTVVADTEPIEEGSALEHALKNF